MMHEILEIGLERADVRAERARFAVSLEKLEMRAVALLEFFVREVTDALHDVERRALNFDGLRRSDEAQKERRRLETAHGARHDGAAIGDERPCASPLPFGAESPGPWNGLRKADLPLAFRRLPPDGGIVSSHGQMRIGKVSSPIDCGSSQGNCLLIKGPFAMLGGDFGQEVFVRDDLRWRWSSAYARCEETDEQGAEDDA